MGSRNNRRSFLKSSLAAGGMLLAGQSLFAETAGEEFSENIKGENFTFLFQGDSITDGNRTRNNDWNHVMGHGYQFIIASKLWYDFPEKKFHFFNRGISGNTITDLEKRWDTDTIALKPDLLSMLIGINDISAWINGNKNYTPEAFGDKYRDLLQKTKTELPSVQLVLCEPFILPVGKVKEKWELYDNEIRKYQAIVQKLSMEFNAIHVAFQQCFDKALKKAPADYWIWDGIHPMPAGHQLMAVEWTKQAGKRLKFINR
jgi:lysophospholipase L1-like esterase